jgi:hypothetical protein
MLEEPRLSQLHYQLIQGLIENGRCPTNSELGNRMRISSKEVEHLLRSLAKIHGVVLQPHICEPWIIHPFSLTPTINWIETGGGRSWWAPCVWCALGITTLVGHACCIHTRYGAEGEALNIQVINGQPTGADDIYLHFAIPPVRAWDNVHQHCSMVLPFRSPDDVSRWCDRHRLPRGEAVPIQQVAKLAKNWYGLHSDPNWRKWTIAEAQDIFHRTGLHSAFWDLGARSGKF